MKSLLFLLLFVSCSSWNKEACLTTNWYHKGVEDAARSGSGNFNPYKRACAEAGVSITSSSGRYEKGVLEGMRSWCTFQNGFNQGLDGKVATAQCDQINPAFARGVEEGYREFRVVQRRKRDDEEREKKYRADTEEFRSRVIHTSNTKECFVDSDCRKDGDCTFSTCRHNGAKCNFNSDCQVQGYCREVSQSTVNGPNIRLRVCDYAY